MEFYILNERIYFRNRYKVEDTTSKVTRRCPVADRDLVLNAVTDCAGDWNNEEDYDCDYGGNCFRKGLQELMTKHSAGSPRYRWFTDSQPRREMFHMMVDLTMTSSKTASLKILQGKSSMADLMGAQIFDGLKKSTLPPKSYGFNVKLTLFDMDTGNSTDQFEISGKDMKVTKPNNEFYGLEVKNVKIKDELWREWKQKKVVGDDSIDYVDYDEKFAFEAEIELTLRLDHCAITKLYVESLGMKGFIHWPSFMRIGGKDTNMVILAGGETNMEKGIKCHKEILSGRSPVFEAMFQTDMLESKNGCLRIVDMTKAGVLAMLKFMYSWDLEEASKNGEIAVELLEAGHKYQMELLEDAMMQIIWTKPFNWLSVDLALKLCLFSSNVGGEYKRLQDTCCGLLKWYTRNSGSLLKSKEYQLLLHNAPEIAMELTDAIITI